MVHSPRHLVLALMLPLLGGCGVVDLAATTASTAVAVTRTVVGTTVDVVTSPFEDDD
ncbi:MAG: hypothetical protein HQL39_20115 [Alphaproteobacteria bacterium]|nr:hypothetical protein [Alphaproteobacteria bacterium]MBF0375703.1 hypothetical protein [Alphaproteobacteria bacterium]